MTDAYSGVSLQMSVCTFDISVKNKRRKRMKRISLVLMILILASTMIFAQGATEQTSASAKYPGGDISFIIPNSAGGGNDLTTRALIPSLQRTFGVNVVPLNQGESKGAVAAQNVINAKPDGRTFYFNSQTLILLPFSTMPNLDLSQFQPIAQVVEDTGVIYVKADAPYKTINDLLTAMKSTTLKMGHNGNGALWHLASLQLAKAIGANFRYIAYSSGGTQMLTALAAGEVDLCIVNAAEGKAMVDSGLVRPLASLGETRLDVFNIPTLVESGVDYVFPVWRGVFTKAGVSDEILAEIDKAFKAAAESPEFVEYAKNNGLPIRYRDHKQFKEFVDKEIAIYSELMKSL
ncbi:MAG: tripartite tricarboxylate transporter substrate binding protein [Sphaerochaeta sp.]|nr:tripartite tricarboxylate transporter substrate binding protein [Sphaerochaeta sp.]